MPRRDIVPRREQVCVERSVVYAGVALRPTLLRASEVMALGHAGSRPPARAKRADGSAPQQPETMAPSTFRRSGVDAAPAPSAQPLKEADLRLAAGTTMWLPDQFDGAQCRTCRALTRFPLERAEDSERTRGAA